MQNKYFMENKLKKYFINKYYCPDIPYNFSKYLFSFANTSIDISDGLISDMLRLINSQKLSFSIDVDKIPISKKLNDYLKKHNKPKNKLVFNGDDYQILFTSSKRNRLRIRTIANKLNQKVTIIGKINDGYKKNLLKEDNKSLKLSNFKGYSHKF